MANSKVSLCNMALVTIKANTVTDIDNPTTNEEKLCNIIFDQLADEVMSSGSWTSCIARAELVATANTPEFGYAYEYQLPTSPKCLKVLSLDECRDGEYPYEIEGDKLLTDKSGVKIRYIFKNTNIASWDSLLVQAMVARLRAELVGPIKGDNNRMQLELTRYLQLSQDGLAINNQQGSKQLTQSSSLTDVR